MAAPGAYGNFSGTVIDKSPTKRAGTTRQDYAVAVLEKGGYPVTQANVDALVAWMQNESSAARFNPLDATDNLTGSIPLPGNSAGVQQYASLAQSIDLIAYKWGTSLYSGIHQALSQGNNAGAVISAVNASPWGSVNPSSLQTVQANRAYYYNLPIATSLNEQSVTALAGAGPTGAIGPAGPTNQPDTTSTSVFSSLFPQAILHGATELVMRVLVEPAVGGVLLLFSGKILYDALSKGGKGTSLSLRPGNFKRATKAALG